MPDIRIPTLLGIRNTVAPFRQPMGAMASVVDMDAVGVATDNGVVGTLEQRTGYVLKAALAPTDWFCPPTGSCYFVSGGKVCVFGRDEVVREIADAADAGYRWAFAGNRVHYLGAKDAGTILDEREWRPLRIPRCPMPNVSVIDGSLPHGVYQVSAAFRHPSGMMGGCGPSATIESGGGLRVSVADIPAGHEAVVYAGARNDARPRYAGTTLGEPFDIREPPEDAPALSDLQYLASPPPLGATAIEWHANRLWAATHRDGVSSLWASQPGTAHWFRFDPAHLAQNPPHQFQGKVTALQSTAQGLVVCAEQQWLVGEGIDLIAGYGAPSGRPLAKDQDGKVWGWTDQGVFAYPGGNLTVNKCSLPPGNNCHATVYRAHGRKLLIAWTDGQGEAANAY